MRLPRPGCAKRWRHLPRPERVTAGLESGAEMTDDAKAILDDSLVHLGPHAIRLTRRARAGWWRLDPTTAVRRPGPLEIEAAIAAALASGGAERLVAVLRAAAVDGTASTLADAAVLGLTLDRAAPPLVVPPRDGWTSIRFDEREMAANEAQAAPPGDLEHWVTEMAEQLLAQAAHASPLSFAEPLAGADDPWLDGDAASERKPPPPATPGRSRSPQPVEGAVPGGPARTTNGWSSSQPASPVGATPARRPVPAGLVLRHRRLSADTRWTRAEVSGVAPSGPRIGEPHGRPADEPSPPRGSARQLTDSSGPAALFATPVVDAACAQTAPSDGPQQPVPSRPALVATAAASPARLTAADVFEPAVTFRTDRSTRDPPGWSAAAVEHRHPGTRPAIATAQLPAGADDLAAAMSPAPLGEDDALARIARALADECDLRGLE